jgi:c-di-GMP-binding flagellar brake protein YcgR
MKLILDKKISNSDGEELKIEDGQLVSISFVQEESVKDFTVRIKKIEYNNEHIEVFFDEPDGFTTNQRRNYFRLDTHDFKKKLKDTEEHRVSVMDVGLKITAFSRGVSIEKNYKTELVNISGGGILCFFSCETPPINSLLEIRLLIPGFGVVEAIGRTARVEKSEKNSSSFLIGITFIQIKEKDREKILEFTYTSNSPKKNISEVKF